MIPVKPKIEYVTHGSIGNPRNNGFEQAEFWDDPEIKVLKLKWLRFFNPVDTTLHCPHFCAWPFVKARNIQHHPIYLLLLWYTLSILLNWIDFTSVKAKSLSLFDAKIIFRLYNWRSEVKACLNTCQKIKGPRQNRELLASGG